MPSVMNNLKKIGLIVDEGADLTPEIIEKYQIAIVPLKVIWPPEIENLPGPTIFHKMAEADKKGFKIFCQTSQPSPKDFLDILKKELERCKKIICITITSKLSGTYNSAIQAKNFLNPEDQKRVFVVDSLNASCGMGLLVLRTIDLIGTGREIEEIVKDLEGFTSKIQLRAIIEDPKWLEHSGRISKTIANWIRMMAKLGVRPLIGIKQGVVKAVGIKTGVKDVSEALFQELAAKTKKTRKEGKKIRVAIIHCLNEKGAEKLKEMIEKKLPDTEIAFVNLIDKVVGSIVGPGVVGLAWHKI
jgi:DegV family protein with EDD domain